MNKIATIGIAVSAAANSVLAGEINWDALNRQAYEESLIPVALPARDHIPFWNRNARRFIHPPAFEIAPIDGIRKYRFELTDDDGKVLAFGSHQELCQTCKEYANMVELQRLEDEYGGDK